jgi:GH24 family phage-related lysozyme (muramidase)
MRRYLITFTDYDKLIVEKEERLKTTKSVLHEFESKYGVSLQNESVEYFMYVSEHDALNEDGIWDKFKNTVATKFNTVKNDLGKFVDTTILPAWLKLTKNFTNSKDNGFEKRNLPVVPQYSDQIEFSKFALRVLVTLEDFSPIPYWDSIQWTWGFGTRVPDSSNKQEKKPNVQPIDKKKAADEMFQKLATKYEPDTKAVIKQYNLTLNQNAYDALVSFCYNRGKGNLVKLVQSANGKVENIPEVLASSYSDVGIKKRRMVEAMLFAGSLNENEFQRIMGKPLLPYDSLFSD